MPQKLYVKADQRYTFIDRIARQIYYQVPLSQLEIEQHSDQIKGTIKIKLIGMNVQVPSEHSR